MNMDLHRAIATIALSFLFFATTACAESPEAQRVRLFNKAIALTNEACNIYPVISDLDQCVDKVVRSVLSERGVKPEQQEVIISEQKAITASRRGPLSGETREERQLREARDKLLDIINASCAVLPAITDLNLCMDKAYHSILSSRDPHSSYMNEEEVAEFRKQMSGDLQGIGIEVGLTEDGAIGVVRVISGSPAEKAGMKDGDRIIAVINGIERILSSSFLTIDKATEKLRGKPNTEVTLEILRGEKNIPVTVTVTRAAIKLDMVKTEILTAPTAPDVKYAYVKIVHFGDGVRAKMVTAIKGILRKQKNIKGVIFDVRDNPGGLLDQVYEMVDALLDSPDALVSIRDNNGVHAYPDERGGLTPQVGDIADGLPMAVFIDGYSASASEIFAGVLKEFDRAVIIGKGTWRKGTVQRITSFGDGSFFKATESEYLIGPPTRWVAVQCVGIEPDIAYEAEVIWKPTKEMHECDLPGAVVSGGARSDPSSTKRPLRERNPVLYGMGEKMLAAVSAFDQKAFTKNAAMRKQLKLKDPRLESKDEKE